MSIGNIQVKNYNNPLTICKFLIKNEYILSLLLIIIAISAYCMLVRLSTIPVSLELRNT